MTKEKFTSISLQEEMQRSYLEYAMSVIIGRALPDARDGLKPVQRRILFAMHELGLTPDRPFRKMCESCGRCTREISSSWGSKQSTRHWLD